MVLGNKNPRCKKRGGCRINSKISNRDNNSTLIILLYCHFVGHYYVANIEGL